MTGTHDITMCADIIYGNISKLTFHRLASFLLQIISRVPVPGRALLENGLRYRDSDFTAIELCATTWYQYMCISKSET